MCGKVKKIDFMFYIFPDIYAAKKYVLKLRDDDKFAFMAIFFVFLILTQKKMFKKLCLALEKCKK